MWESIIRFRTLDFHGIFAEPKKFVIVKFGGLIRIPSQKHIDFTIYRVIKAFFKNCLNVLKRLLYGFPLY